MKEGDIEPRGRGVGREKGVVPDASVTEEEVLSDGEASSVLQIEEMGEGVFSEDGGDGIVCDIGVTADVVVVVARDEDGGCEVLE